MIVKTLLRSQELSCPSCVRKIETSLKQVQGVDQARVHFSTGRIDVEHDGVDEEKLVEAVREAGYNAQVSAF